MNYDYRKRQFEPGEFPDYISRTVERSDKRTGKIADDSKILTLSTFFRSSEDGWLFKGYWKRGVTLQKILFEGRPLT